MAKSILNARKSMGINASSMADIAFLLLIFFLVTATILQDKGILVQLPVWQEDSIIDTGKVKKRNLFIVKLNANDNLMVRGKVTKVEDLKEQAKAFIWNPLQDEALSETPAKAIISLQHDRSTSYEKYIQVYNELKAAYSELWTELSMQLYGIPYDEGMELAMKREIRREIPFIISEAEPTDFEQEKF